MVWRSKMTGSYFLGIKVNFLNIFSWFFHSHPAKSKSRSPRGFLPRPLLRAGNQSRFCENPNPQKIVFAKPSPLLAPRRKKLPPSEFRQFLPSRRNPSLASLPTYRKKKIWIAPNKKELDGSEARAVRHSRSGGTALAGCRGADAGSWRNGDGSPNFILKVGSNLVQ